MIMMGIEFGAGTFSRPMLLNQEFAVRVDDAPCQGGGIDRGPVADLSSSRARGAGQHSHLDGHSLTLLSSSECLR